MPKPSKSLASSGCEIALLRVWVRVKVRVRGLGLGLGLGLEPRVHLAAQCLGLGLSLGTLIVARRAHGRLVNGRARARARARVRKASTFSGSRLSTSS